MAAAAKQEEVMLKRIAMLMVAATACGGTNDPSEALVGRWELHDDETGELESNYAFDEEGGYAFREYGEGAEDNRGTYEADDGLLTMEGTDGDGNQVLGRVSYFADDERLILGALLPDGDVDGPVGRWSGSVHVESNGEVAIDAESSYELSTGGGATITARNGSSSQTIDDATWVDEAGEIVVSFEADGGITVNIHMVLVEGEAMGSPVYQRADG
jgi:hypothetical protein